MIIWENELYDWKGQELKANIYIFQISDQLHYVLRSTDYFLVAKSLTGSDI